MMRHANHGRKANRGTSARPLAALRDANNRLLLQTIGDSVKAPVEDEVQRKSLPLH